jgi:cell division protein FtsI (penicillin-binding protein 3)
MQKSYRLRTAYIFFFFCAAYLIVIAHLFRIQIINTQFFTQLGEKQYYESVTVSPPRAAIFDCTGTHFLAMNKDSIAAFILPKKLTSPQTLKPFLKKNFPQAYERLRNVKDTHFMYIARRLTDEQIALINNAAIADIKLLNEPSRYYPVPAAGSIIGITDIDNSGLFGLEMSLNSTLAGTPTTYLLERDARSGRYYFKHCTTKEGNQGIPVHTTIDADLQFFAREELHKTIEQFQAKEGAVVIMNPANGHVLVMTSLPDFDPNDTKHIVMEHAKNRVVTEEYELGSVIKTCAALAALAEGVVSIDELIDCENVPTSWVDGRRINTVPSSVAGIIPFSEVIEKSNNIGIAKVVKRLGTKLYDHYIRMGFGKKTGIEFPGERSGFVNAPMNWSKQSLFSLSYGYEISATLLQLATFFSMIANNGYSVQPTLFMHTSTPKSKQLYDAPTIATMQQILENTVIKGSAKKAHIKGYRIMSKTGTANMLVNGQYDPNKNIYTCAGIVERGNYKRVIVTFVKEAPKKNLYASMVTAPLFERVAERMLIHNKVV